MIYKFSQSSKETIQRAQAGDEDAIAQVIEENMGLIAKELTKWGLTPGSEDFEDTVSDIKVEMISKIIPRYDPSRGAFSTFLTTAIYNFLRRGTRRKEYEEKQKEVSITEPVGEGITLEDTLKEPTSFTKQIALESARESLQNYIHIKKPELEPIILRIFDLKMNFDYSHDRIAEILNEEDYATLFKGKLITRFMVNNYVNEWIKPVMQQFLEAFRSASLSMRKQAGTWAFPYTYNSAMDLMKIVMELKSIGDEVLTVLQANKLHDSLYEVFGDDKLFDDLAVEAEREGLLVTGHTASQIIGERLEEELRHYESNPEDFSDAIGVKALKILDDLVASCKDPTSKIREVPLEEMFKVEKEPRKEVEKQILPEQELSKETIEVPYAELLNKYTEDEIWDIASGKKLDVSKEEVEQAKEVISRGIIAKRLSMRKKGKNG